MGSVATLRPSAPLFDRLPERLVVDGFRRWMAGYATGDLGHWEAAWNLHATAVGARSSRILVERLAQFTRAVRDWALCPVACFPGGCRTICRQECFALGMVASAQAGDLDCLAAAMRHLLDPDGHEEAMLPALAYADALTENELMLTPVPLSVIEEIACRPLVGRLH